MIDYELDGIPNVTATGDDLHNLDDEDGVLIGADDTSAPLFGTLNAGAGSYIYVDASAAGYLNAWLDINGDGDWDDPLEQIFTDELLSPGRNTLTISLDAGLPPVDTYARFRFGSEQGLSYGGAAIDGEVEDYPVSIVGGDSSISGWKFNDLNADGVWNIQGSTIPVPRVTLQDIGTGQQVLMSGRDSDGLLYPNVGPNDDLSSALQSLGFSFEFFGNTYTDFYINNNGNITFDNPLGRFLPTGFPSPTPIVAPFWADVDTRTDTAGAAGGEVQMSTGVSVRGNPFVQVDWIDVGYFDRTDAGNNDGRNTFSLYIEDDPVGDIVVFDYGSLNWSTGDSTGTDGLGGLGAQIGFDSGDGTNFLSLMRPNDLASLSDLLQIEQYAFRIDPATGTPVKAEPGMAGVSVFLDVNGNGVRDHDAFGNLERMTVTMEDDPSTPDIDETGYYEFSPLFAGTYDVKWPYEMAIGNEWVQTGAI